MMVSLPPTAGDNALAILAAASNPEQAKAYIQEIMKVTQEMQNTLEATRQANIEADSIKRAIDEGEKSVSGREQELENAKAAFETSMSQRKVASDEVHQQAMQSYADASESLSRATDTRAEADKRLSQVVSRENAISQREQDVSKREDAVSTLEATLNSKLEALKQIVN